MANVKKLTIYDAQGNPTTYDVKDYVSGYEVATNKATSLANPDNTKYPTTKVVSDGLNAITNSLGTQVTYNLSGTTLRITTK